MEIYRTLWKTLWAVLLTTGAVCSFVLLPATGLIWAVLLGIAVASICVVLLPYLDGNLHDLAPGAVLSRAVWVCCGFVAAVGLTALMGLAIVPLALVVAASSPGSVTRLKRLVVKAHPLPHHVEPRKGRRVVEKPLVNGPVPGWDGHTRPTRGLSDAELCRTWRGTYFGVIGAGTASELDRLCSLRAACLDELQRRDPAAFAAWIDSGARASGDPEKYFVQNLGNRRKDAA